MKINRDTKISALIKENPKSIEAIVSVIPHLSKLRNPLLRGILAARTSIGDAAHSGKCDIQTLYKSLAEIGFEIEKDVILKEEKKVLSANPEIVNAIKQAKVTTLDVRPTLAKGGDPFSEIMGELKRLQDGYALEVINTFEPTPLIKIANTRGYASMVETKGDVVYTYLFRVAEAIEESASNSLVFRVSFSEHEERRANCKKEIREIDVRDLEMPLPMVTILKELEELKENEALYVHHKKVPQYLLPELVERNFKTWIADVGENNVKLLIHK